MNSQRENVSIFYGTAGIPKLIFIYRIDKNYNITPDLWADFKNIHAKELSYRVREIYEKSHTLITHDISVIVVQPYEFVEYRNFVCRFKRRSLVNYV